MAVTSIMTTEGEIDQKLGANVDPNFTEAMKNAAVLQGESMVNAVCRYDFSTNFGDLTAATQGILSDIVSSFVAIQGVTYNMAGYTSRIEAEDMINVLRDGMLRGLQIVRDKNVQKFLTDVSVGTI